MTSSSYSILSPVTALLVTATNLQEGATFCGGTVDTPTDDEASVSVPTSSGPVAAYVGSYIVQKGNSFGVIPGYIFSAIYQ